MAWPSNISCDWSTSLKHSQSECSSHEANSRPSDCIAAHYKIVSIKIADKLAIKINIGYMAQLVKCGVHITRKVKSIHAIFITYYYCRHPDSAPRCMECRRGLAMRILSVRMSVCLSVRGSVTRVNCDKTV